MSRAPKKANMDVWSFIAVRNHAGGPQSRELKWVVSISVCR